MIEVAITDYTMKDKFGLNVNYEIGGITSSWSRRARSSDLACGKIIKKLLDDLASSDPARSQTEYVLKRRVRMLARFNTS